jgi:hypothetical protein
MLVRRALSWTTLLELAAAALARGGACRPGGGEQRKAPEPTATLSRLTESRKSPTAHLEWVPAK